VATNVQAQLEEIVGDLQSTAGNTSGSRRVGVEGIPGVPVSVPSGTLLTGLAAVVSGVNAHITSPAGAHAASAVSIQDTAGVYASENVEVALAELGLTFSQGHTRFNETAPGVGAGWHKTIRQPLLTNTGLALLFESRGAGAVIRIYGGQNGVVFTVNAEAVNGWTKDDPALPSVQMILDTGGFLLGFQVGPTPFPAFTRRWQILFSGTEQSGTLALNGPVNDFGRISCEATNADTATRNITMGNSATFHVLFPAAPTSVTLFTLVRNSFVDTPAIELVTREGFSIQSTQNVAAGVHSRWVGRFIAVS
jgi:hypothetical protein